MGEGPGYDFVTVRNHVVQMRPSPDALAKDMPWSYAMRKNAQPKVSGTSDGFELDS